MYKVIIVIGAIIAISGAAVSVIGFNAMTNWQHIASSGKASTQEGFATAGTIGIATIVLGLVILIGGFFLSIWAYNRRYN